MCLVAQSCPTLCDSVNCSPPGSPVPGDPPGKNTQVGINNDILLLIILHYHSFNLRMTMSCSWKQETAWQSCAGKIKMRLNGGAPTWTTRKDTFHTVCWDYTQELNQDKGAVLIIKPCPSSGDLPNPGTEPRSPTLQEYSLASEAPRKPQ